MLGMMEEKDPHYCAVVHVSNFRMVLDLIIYFTTRFFKGCPVMSNKQQTVHVLEEVNKIQLALVLQNQWPYFVGGMCQE